VVEISPQTYEWKVLEKFKSIFAGLETAHGYSYLNKGTSEKGKKEADSKSKREPVTNELWQKHLDGIQPSLGIFLIKDNSKCKFGCVDIDIYNLDHKEILKKINEKKLPLILIKSKSGGAHVYLFTKEFVAASVMRQKLKKIAGLIGFAKSEIYPKQDYVKSENKELGSWLNIPYFGGDNAERHALDDNGNKLNLEEFFKLYDQKVLTETDLINLNFESGEDDFLKGAPPCLITLLKDGIPEGTRNEMMYNIGVYLKKRFPEGWQSKMYLYNAKFMIPELIHKEIESLLVSLNKKDYRYKCKQEPIASFCDSKSCVKKEFGVGGDAPAPEIESITKYPSDPPIYYVYIDGIGVEVDEATLHDPEKFSIACMVQINRPLMPIGKVLWRKMLIKLHQPPHFEEMDVIETSKLDYQLKELLADFINKAPGKKIEDIKRGLPFTEDGYTYFKYDSLQKFLSRSKSWNLPKQKTQKMLIDYFKAGEETPKIDKKTIRVWKIETVALDKPIVRNQKLKEPSFK
jgi:hypothetical protein